MPYDRIFAASFSLAIFFIWTHCTRAAEPMEEAKKEGEVVFYGNVRQEHITKLNESFQKKYPFIKVQYLRAGPLAVMNRVMTEARVGSRLVDVINLDVFNSWVLKEAGLLQPYKSSETEAFPEQYRDPSGLVPCCMYVSSNVIGYNTKLVAPHEIPKTYNDLLDQKWKGKIGVKSDDSKWFAPLVWIWGRDRAVNYFRGLMKQQPVLREGISINGQLLAAGEVSVFVNIAGDVVLNLQSVGAPVEIVQAAPSIFRPGNLLLAKNAPHPNAARLFMDYVHSAEGQQVLADLGREVARPGIKMKYPRLQQTSNLVPVKPEMAKNDDELLKLYESILKNG